MNKETLSLPVPYTLIMTGTGSFVATWQPVVPSHNYPSIVRGQSLARSFANSMEYRTVESTTSGMVRDGMILHE